MVCYWTANNPTTTYHYLSLLGQCYVRTQVPNMAGIKPGSVLYMNTGGKQQLSRSESKQKVKVTIWPHYNFVKNKLKRIKKEEEGEAAAVAETKRSEIYLSSSTCLLHNWRFLHVVRCQRKKNYKIMQVLLIHKFSQFSLKRGHRVWLDL